MLDSKYMERFKTIFLVGAGGKTTVMYDLAGQYTAQGRKVICTTSTHIFDPDMGFAQTIEEVQDLWSRGQYVVIGTRMQEEGKLCAPNDDFLQQVYALADVVLVEADGARRMALKIPRPNEPVLWQGEQFEPACVIAVAGLDAIGKHVMTTVFGLDSHHLKDLRGMASINGEWYVTPELMAQLLTEKWGGRKGVGERAFFVVLNKSDVVATSIVDETVQALLDKGLVAEQVIVR